MKTGIKAPTATTVDEYLASVPAQDRAVLEALRRTIRAAAPMAAEKISYGMPAFMEHGPLVFFAAFRDHLGFYGVSREIIDRFSSELEPFRTSSTTLHFSAENPLPAALVTHIVKARVAENELREEAKRKR